jgi:hypothetical protein
MPAILRFNRFEEACGGGDRCLQQVPVGRQRINHLPHLILTLRPGVWVFLWIWDARREHAWQCPECGATVHKIMSHPFEDGKFKRR